MKKITFTLGIYRVIAMMLLVFSVNAMAQRVVTIPKAETPGVAVNIGDFLRGDTIVGGDRVDPNTTYLLERDGLYETHFQIVTSGYNLTLKAADGTGGLPVIKQKMSTGGGWNKLFNLKDTSYFESIQIDTRQDGLTYEWLGLNVSGQKHTFKDCVFEYSRGGAVIGDGDGVNIFIDGCTFRYLGDPDEFAVNGRIVDPRKYVDTVVIKNSTMYNASGYIYRGGGRPSKYIEIDHNTFFNSLSRDKMLSTGSPHGKFILTNNIFANMCLLGTWDNEVRSTTLYKDIDNNPADTLLPLTCVALEDSLRENGEYIIENNNFFWTQDVLDLYENELADSIYVSREIFDPAFFTKLGIDPDVAFFSEQIDFANAPAAPLDHIRRYWLEAMMYPDSAALKANLSGGAGSFIPLHPLLNPNNDPYTFAFNEADFGSSVPSESGRLGIGDPRWTLAASSGVGVSDLHSETKISIYPNPSRGILNIQVPENSYQQYKIFSITGQIVRADELRSEQTNLNIQGLNQGIYMITFTGKAGNYTTKFVRE